MLLKSEKDWENYIKALEQDSISNGEEIEIEESATPLWYPCIVKPIQEVIEAVDLGELGEVLDDADHEEDAEDEDLEFDSLRLTLYNFIFIYKTEIEELLKL